MPKGERVRNLKNILILLILLFTISMVISSQTSETSEKNSKIPQTIDELKIKLENLLQKHKFPGVGVALVSKDSIIWIGSIGVANVKVGIPVTEDTHFRVGSITKTFIGLGFLKLVEENKIDLNTSVRELAPEIEIINPWEDTHPVRIVHLLEHTAGFDDIHLNSLYNREDPDMPLKQALEVKKKLRKVRWQPGTRHAYSSVGYTVAGYILEKITGKPYEDYLKEAILEPIGMATSTFRLTDESKRLLSEGYGNNCEPFPYIVGYDRPSSSLNSSIKEMALFVQFLLSKGKAGGQQILSEASIDQLGIHTTTIASKSGLKDGYSFGVGSRFEDGFKWLGHSGGGPGFIAKYSYLKENGFGYVVLANKFSVSKFREITSLVQSYLIRDANPPFPKLPVQVSSHQFEKYIGYYELRSSRQKLVEFLDVLIGGTKISFKNGTLYQQDFMNRKIALIPVSSNMFRKSDEPDASRIFIKTPEGKMVFATLGSYYEKTASWRLFIYRTLVFGALIILISAVIYAFFWVPIHLFKKMMKKENRTKYLRMRVIPLLAVLSLVFGIIVVSNQLYVNIGFMTIQNIIFFISTLLFAALSILSLVFSIISFKKPVKMIARIYAGVLSLSCFGLTLYLTYWGIIGLRIWAY